MNIQPGQNNNISMQGKRWERFTDKIMQKTLDLFPEHTAKESARKLEKWNNFDNWVSRPDINRGVMGATALVTQPFIDASNHKVDEETRKVSICRTIAKIIAGTGVGMFVVRGPLYKAITSMTNINGKSKYSKKLIPKIFLQEMSNNEKFLKNYRSALSMSIALGAMCVTNFVLDAPLTIALTNLFKDKVSEKSKEKEVKNE